MPISTKKPSTSDQAGAYRTLDAHPRWIEAVAARERLAARASAYNREAGPGNNRTGQQITVDALADHLLEWAASEADTPEPERSEIAASVSSGGERREAARLALERHDAAMTRLRYELAPEIYRQWEREHLESRKALVAAIIAVKAAFETEHSYAHRIVSAGGLVDIRHRLICNFSGCGALPRLLASLDVASFLQCNRNLLD